MADEAKLEPRQHGHAPAQTGWFVLNARDAAWTDGPFGAYTPFEGPETRFAELGINIAVLQPGQPNCYYHAEDAQEDFLVLEGECVLIVEDQERPLRRWDFVHCPAWTRHVFVGAGDRPCLLLGVGNRAGESIVYPVSDVARRHGAGVDEQTDDPVTAYAAVEPDQPLAFDPRWLP
jgi:uncharacterized cupin superfamily protein